MFCEKALLWTDDDYLGPLHVQTERRGPRSSRRRLPEWAGSFTVPEVYAKALAQYAEPTKAFLDALGRLGQRRRSGHPAAATALAAHRLVDRAYASAAAGGPEIGGESLI